MNLFVEWKLQTVQFELHQKLQLNETVENELTYSKLHHHVIKWQNPKLCQWQNSKLCHHAIMWVKQTYVMTA